MYKSGETEIWLLSVILTALFSLHLGNIFGVCGIFYWSVMRFGVFVCSANVALAFAVAATVAAAVAEEISQEKINERNELHGVVSYSREAATLQHIS